MQFTDLCSKAELAESWEALGSGVSAGRCNEGPVDSENKYVR